MLAYHTCETHFRDTQHLPSVTEPTTVGGAMIAVELTEGTHHVVFSYRNEAFSLGWRISLFCLVIFCGIVSVKYYFWPKRPRGRYERR